MIVRKKRAHGPKRKGEGSGLSSDEGNSKKDQRKEGIRISKVKTSWGTGKKKSGTTGVSSERKKRRRGGTSKWAPENYQGQKKKVGGGGGGWGAKNESRGKSRETL